MADFASDDDGDLTNTDFQDEKEEEAAWRCDPESSFSDWTIRVIQSSDCDCDENLYCHSDEISSNDAATDKRTHSKIVASKSATTYHVHRVYLASGGRKSEYFQTLFSLETDTEESLSSTTELVLPESACMIFSQFLDYLYDHTSEKYPTVEECSENAKRGDRDACRGMVALLYLADYFRVPRLMCLVQRRIKDVLSRVNRHFFCQEALRYNIGWIVDDCIGPAAQFPDDFLSPMEDDNETDADAAAVATTTTTFLELLPAEKQIELLKLSLSQSLQELRRFKRVPSNWKGNICTVAATHMPTLMRTPGSERQSNPNDSEDLSKQGCGLSFSKTTCPLFYFE